ncbi:MAG TPA: response regulator transcription factor [Ktedonobacterales bacterium]
MGSTPIFGGVTQDARPRVLLVEADAQLHDFLRLGFDYEGCQVSSAPSAADALHIVALHAPDVLVIEQELPDLSGSALIRQLRAIANDAVVVLLENTTSVDARVEGLDAGADDVMSKPIAFCELMARVAAGLRRCNGLNPHEQLAFEDISLDRRAHLVHRRGRVIALTPREFDLLACFLRHPRQILLRDTIIDYVWGNEYRGDSNVLDVYIHALREKLEDRPPRLLRTVRGMGYVLRGRDARTPRLGSASREMPMWAPAGPSVPRRAGPLPAIGGGSPLHVRKTELVFARG